MISAMCWTSEALYWYY